MSTWCNKSRIWSIDHSAACIQPSICCICHWYRQSHSYLGSIGTFPGCWWNNYPCICCICPGRPRSGSLYRWSDTYYCYLGSSQWRISHICHCCQPVDNFEGWKHTCPESIGTRSCMCSTGCCGTKCSWDLINRACTVGSTGSTLVCIRSTRRSNWTWSRTESSSTGCWTGRSHPHTTYICHPQISCKMGWGYLYILPGRCCSTCREDRTLRWWGSTDPGSWTHTRLHISGRWTPEWNSWCRSRCLSKFHSLSGILACTPRIIGSSVSTSGSSLAHIVAGCSPTQTHEYTLSTCLYYPHRSSI